ncbi:MAG: ATP-binding protein [Thermoplasmatota archaeon]
MIPKTILGTILKDQASLFVRLTDTVPRSLLPFASTYQGSSAFVIKGLRRSGKSTLLQQISMSRSPQDHLYFNFDDERLIGFTADDFQTLVEVFIELFGKKNNLYFDEIQNVPGWEVFINRLLREGYCIYITGSNAHLLSSELGTYLTGRHTDIELYPFSFTEYLRSQHMNSPTEGIYSTEEKALFLRAFKEYLSFGGMPEVVVHRNETILSQVVNDIIHRDIVTRHNIRKPAELKNVIRFLIANTANAITYRSIQNNFRIKSANTIQKYIDYAEETYLLFSVHKYEPKIKQFDKNPKKIYCVDPGIVARNIPLVGNQGAILETIVAIQLKRLGIPFYYFSEARTNAECDFVVPALKHAIQVCYQFHMNNKEREIKGLIEALKLLNTKQGYLLTLDQEEQFVQDGKTIIVKPVWQWLLNNEPKKKE